MDGNVVGDERIVSYIGYGVADVVFGMVEFIDPGGKLAFYGVDSGGLDAAAEHGGDELLGCGVGHAAVVVADDHDFLYAELVDADEQAADDIVKAACDGVAGSLDDLGFTAAHAEGRFEKVDEARVHAGDYGELALGQLADGRKIVGQMAHEMLIGLSDFG